jgi:hypothetical protein
MKEEIIDIVTSTTSGITSEVFSVARAAKYLIYTLIAVIVTATIVGTILLIS